MYDEETIRSMSDTDLEPARQRAMYHSTMRLIEADDAIKARDIRTGDEWIAQAVSMARQAKMIENEIMRRARVMWDEIHSK